MRDDLSVRPIEHHEFDTWDEFVAASPHGTLFHTSVWKRVIDSCYAPASLALIGCFDRTSLLGGCVFLDRARLGHKTAVTPLLTPYSGFLPGAGMGEKISSLVSDQADVLRSLAKYMSAEYEYQNLQTAPGIEDLRPLQELGYTVTPRFTYYLNLKLPLDELWQRLDGSVRRQIKKAEKEDFVISDMIDPETAYAMFQKTFSRRKQKCPVSRRLFDELCISEHLRDYREVFCAHQGSQPASYIVTLRYQKTMYYALASTAEEFLPTGVSSFLIWEIMKVHACQELDTLDFVGANVPAIARFKEGFNPRLVMHFQAESFGSGLLKLGKSIAKMLRKS